MYFIYIFYFEVAEKYYVGYTSDYKRRLIDHTSLHNTFTSKYRPWQIKAVFECGDDEGTAIQIERFIKKQKSKTFIQRF